MPTCVCVCVCVCLCVCVYVCVVRARTHEHNKSEHVLSAHRRDNDDEIENVPGATEEAPLGDQTQCKLAEEACENQTLHYAH